MLALIFVLLVFVVGSGISAFLSYLAESALERLEAFRRARQSEDQE